MVAENFSIIASEQNFEVREIIMLQCYCHQPVYLGADIWLAAIGSADALG